MLPENMLRESYKKALYSLVLKGETTQYDLKAATNLNYASVHEAIEQYLKLGLIRETRKEAGPGPSPKRFFGLTIRGLAFAFKTLDLSNHMSKVAENWGHLLPFVVGKWGHFASENLENEFMTAFRWVLMWILEWGYDEKEFATERFWYFIFQRTVPEVKAKWLKALRADPELREWAIDEMKIWLAEGRTLMEIHKRSLEVLEMTVEPDWNTVKNSLRLHRPKLPKEIEAKLDAQFKEKMRSL